MMARFHSSKIRLWNCCGPNTGKESNVLTGREIELDRIAFDRWLAGEQPLGGPIQEAAAIVRDRNRNRLEWIKRSAERYAKATAELRARMAQQRHAREISPAFIERKQRELATLMAACKARENRIMARLDGRLHFIGLPCSACGQSLRYTDNDAKCVACCRDRSRRTIRKSGDRYHGRPCGHCGGA